MSDETIPQELARLRTENETLHKRVEKLKQEAQEVHTRYSAVESKLIASRDECKQLRATCEQLENHIKKIRG